MNITIRLHDGYPTTYPEHRNTVRQLQTLLNARGFELPADGMFGPVTEDAVRRFQRHEGLVEDGIVGALTWAALANETPLIIPTFETVYALDNPSLGRQEREATKYKEAIRQAAEAAGVPRCVICGIGSRESAWGLALSPQGPEGTGDYARRTRIRPWRQGYYPPDQGGFGRGLMQIDYDWHEFARGDDWRDATKNLLYAAGVLADAEKAIHHRMPHLGQQQRLRATLAAYNCGPGNVLTALRTGRDVDYFTTGRDYSRDVLSRAAWFELKGW